MQENQYYSYNLGPLPKGCQMCVRGAKLVLFVTGICPRKCSFCPVSDEKYQHDVIFANERSVTATEDLLKEAEAMKAKGAGITGGDPLAKLERTLGYIKLLKQKYGSHFHIHLYTSLDLVTEETLQRLAEAGLDEIRFHLELESDKLWKRVELAKKHSWDIGVELPLIPGKDYTKVVDFIHDKVNFLNLNELEVADNSQSQLLKLGSEVKDELSYAVKGSVEVGLELLRYIQDKKYSFSVHVCTAKLKDAVQLGNRLKREAKYSKREFDQVDEEGLLTRGALYLPELAPGFSYREKLAQADKTMLLGKLKPLYTQIRKELKLHERIIYVDEQKVRILLSKKNVQKNLKLWAALQLQAAIVSEYPTADQLEIEVELL